MAEPVGDDAKTSENHPSVDTEPMEIHGEISSVETPMDDGLLGKCSENLNASAEALSSSSTVSEKSSSSSLSSLALLEKSSSSSKLNAQAPVFVPRAQVAVDVGGSIPPSFTEHSLSEQEVSASEAESAAAPTPSSKAVLTEELRQKVVKQVEFYFSDSNLPTDKYLMKFVKKDPEGFVPIPVVASFRKVKSIVSNHSLVAVALRTSSQLVVSEDGKKVRRLHPLADTDIEEVQSRTVVAENLPNDYSIQNLEKLFGTVGSVKLVRVFQPQRYDSGQVSIKAHRNDMFVSSKLHALVEYETVEQAEKAVADLNDGGNWRSGLQVQLLLKRMGKYGHQPKGRQLDNADVHGEEEDGNNTSDTGNDKQSKVTTQHSDRHDEFEGDAHHPNERNGGRKGRGRGRGKPRGRGQYHGNGRGHLIGAASASSSTSSEGVVKQPPGPRMPDGTRGFTMGRGRPLADSICLEPIFLDELFGTWKSVISLL